MTSKTRTQNKFPSPAPAVESLTHEVPKAKRQATVYDAVAGRISAAGFIPEIPIISASRDTASSSSSAVPPETVLFRKKNAPMRYEESDFYFASDSLPSQALPDSDLLKALHCYTSDFYSRATADAGRGDWRSMDETALLALGILVEEICRDTLGETGDLVFTEGEQQDEDPHESLPRGDVYSVITTSESAVRSGRSRSRKRRRLDVKAEHKIDKSLL